MRRRISRETNPLAVGEVLAGDGRYVTVKWHIWNGRNQHWQSHKIRMDKRALIPFDADEYKHRHEMVVKAAQDDFGKRLMAAWDTPDAD